MISLTLIIIVLTGLISYQAMNNPAMKADLIFHPATIKGTGQYYRFLTHGFIHADTNHLIFNMLTLYFFGEDVEYLFNMAVGPILGKTAFLLFYLSAIVVSSIHSYIRYHDFPGYSALGASGAVTAIVFSAVVFGPWNWFIFPPVPAIVFAVVYIYYSNVMDKRGTDHIGHNAHLWGGIYGFIFTIAFFGLLQPGLLDYALTELLKGPTWPNF